MINSTINAQDADSSLMNSNHRYPWKWWLKDLCEPSNDAPTVFSTFACGGGSSMGYKRAGYKVLGNCEIDPKIANIYNANLHPELSYVMDIREFNTLEDLPDCLYELDVLDGSPPCSTFSFSGCRDAAWGIEKKFVEGQKKQRLDDLFFVYLDTVGKLRPKVFVAENVTGLARGKAKGYVNEIIKKANSLGYNVQMFMLNAAFMGVPQIRERVFFIGNRMGYEKIELNFDEQIIPFGKVRSPNGTGKIIGNGRTKDLINNIKKGDKSLEDAYKRFCGKYGFFNYMINYDDRPSYTLMAQDKNIRFCDRGMFSDVDFVNVATFPQDYDFINGSVKFITGMSVPPSMMANIAHEINAQWLKKL